MFTEAALAEAKRRVEFVECDNCRNRVRKSQAMIAELDDEVVCFCSSDCFEEWETERRIERTREAGEP
jgi:hypothetical protein